MDELEDLRGEDENKDVAGLLTEHTLYLHAAMKKIAAEAYAERGLTPELKEAILGEVRKAMDQACFGELVNAYYARSGNLAHLARMLANDVEFQYTASRLAYEAYRTERVSRPEANIFRRFFQWLLLGEVYPW